MTYCAATARTSGERSARAADSQVVSTTPVKGRGSSRTHADVRTVAVVVDSPKVRDGPVSTTEREPSVRVASSLPSASLTSVRAGEEARTNVHADGSALVVVLLVLPVTGAVLVLPAPAGTAGSNAPARDRQHTVRAARRTDADMDGLLLCVLGEVHDRSGRAALPNVPRTGDPSRTRHPFGVGDPARGKQPPDDDGDGAAHAGGGVGRRGGSRRRCADRVRRPVPRSAGAVQAGAEGGRG